jgi:hypothetical protein
MPKGNLPASRLYILMFDHMQDLYQSVQLISESCIDHLSNFHSQPSKEYLKASEEIEKGLTVYINLVTDGIAASSYKNSDTIMERHNTLSILIHKTIDRVIAEIQKGDVSNRIGLLQTKILLETKDILATINNMYGLYNDYHKEDR